MTFGGRGHGLLVLWLCPQQGCHSGTVFLLCSTASCALTRERTAAGAITTPPPPPCPTPFFLPSSQAKDRDSSVTSSSMVWEGTVFGGWLTTTTTVLLGACWPAADGGRSILYSAHACVRACWCHWVTASAVHVQPPLALSASRFLFRLPATACIAGDFTMDDTVRSLLVPNSQLPSLVSLPPDNLPCILSSLASFTAPAAYCVYSLAASLSIVLVGVEIGDSPAFLSQPVLVHCACLEYLVWNGSTYRLCFVLCRSPTL